MAPDSSHKADELVRLLGQLGYAQEHGAESADELSARAMSLRDELAQELSA